MIQIDGNRDDIIRIINEMQSEAYENYKEEYYSQLQYATSSSTDLHHCCVDNSNNNYYYLLPSFNEWIGYNRSQLSSETMRDASVYAIRKFFNNNNSV
jgi:hypothetical protein